MAVDIPQGGFDVPLMTAKAASLFLGANGGMLIVNPNFVVKHLYKINPPNPEHEAEDAKLTSVIGRGIGSVSLGAAITLYLSTVQNMPGFIAVGVGLLPRLICFVWIMAFYGRTSVLVVNNVVCGWCAFSLLKPLSTAATTWKIFSATSFIKGMALGFFPHRALRSMLGVTELGRKPQAFSRVLGNEVVTSAFFMELLALDTMDPFKTAGYTCLLWIVLLADMAWRTKAWKLIDADRPRTIVYVYMAVWAVFAAGFLGVVNV